MLRQMQVFYCSILFIFQIQASLAFDVIQQQEVTKQLEHGTRQSAYEMQARKFEMARVKDEGDEARQTLVVNCRVVAN